MKCTHCKTGILKPSKIDGLFPAHSCSVCGGDWILIEDYANWKAKHPDYDFSENITENIAENVAKNVSEDNFQVTETNNKAMICPASGSIMQKFRLTSSSEYKINYSAKVGGIWLNKGEWDYLKRLGLAGSLNTLLTEPGQNEILQDATKQHLKQIYQDKFGSEAYQKIQEIRRWLNNHEQKQDLLAYLIADDPYSVNK